MKSISAIITGLLFASILMAANPVQTLAWEQGENYQTHQEINQQALLRFFQAYANGAKYASATLDRQQYYWGPKVGSSSMLQSSHFVHGGTQTFEGWVVHGGFSADEPHLWASVRHFYDPLMINGVPELTDHNWVHGQVYTAISAREWAFRDPGNPFSWKKALEYYKKSMELPEDSTISQVPGSGDFRDPDLPLTPATPAKARQTYLGKAFRSLGETMHMVADMTQPCHVRNDSHPTGDLDPLESNITANNVLWAADLPVDPRIGGLIDSAPDIETMYDSMALYTNRYFYTDDTIFDKASGVKPSNWEGAYPHPQFSDLKLDTATSNSFTAEFNGIQIPLIQKTYSSYKLASMLSLPPGTLWNTPEYHVPDTFADSQAEVLLPIAVKACARVIDRFFPTLELAIDVKDSTDAGQSGNYREYEVNGGMTHLVDRDVEWSKQGLEIKYTGPAELLCDRKGKSVRIAVIQFQDGKIKDPLVLFTGGETTAEEGVEKYKVEGEDSIYCVVKAGGRIFTSNKYPVPSQPQATVKQQHGHPVVDGIQGPTTISWKGGPYQYKLMISGGKPPYSVEWRGNHIIYSGTGYETVQITPSQLRDNGEGYWVFITVKDAAGEYAQWLNEDGVAKQEFTYGVMPQGKIVTEPKSFPYKQPGK